MASWFRSWHGAPSDTRLAYLSKKTGIPRYIVTALWWEILDYASQNTPRGSIEGIDWELIAFQQEIDFETHCNTMKHAVTKYAFVDENNMLKGWEKRQPKREDYSTQRVKKHRENRVETQRNEVKRNETTQIQKQIQNKKEKNKKEKTGFLIPDWVPSDDWNDFVEMRKKLKKPMTDRAKQLKITKLDSLRAGGSNPGRVLQRSVENSWTDIYELPDKERRIEISKEEIQRRREVARSYGIA